MKILPTYGPPRTTRTRTVAMLCAGLLLVMLLCQLYSYEDLAATLGGVLPFNDQPLTMSVAATVVLAELLSLPYLIGMYLSRLMRIVSAFMAGAVSGFWLLSCLTNAHAANSGLFSTTLEIPGGLLPALWSLFLFGSVLSVMFADTRFRHDVSS